MLGKKTQEKKVEGKKKLFVKKGKKLSCPPLLRKSEQV
jgi:hypothetical protein